MLADTKAYFA